MADEESNTYPVDGKRPRAIKPSIHVYFVRATTLGLANNIAGKRA